MKNWEKIVLDSQDKLLSAINILQEESFGIVLVVNKKKKLIGTITDGDVRRGILKFKDTNVLLHKIMKKKPLKSLINTSKKKILYTMEKNELLHMPIVDSKGYVKGIVTVKDLTRKKRNDNIVLIMAGGYGQRLYPLTRDLPKPMIKIDKVPLLEIILENFIKVGFFNFYISTFYKSTEIKKYFGNGVKWGVNIKYINEKKPLGTAGCLGLIKDNLVSKPLILINGDLITNINFEDLLEFHKKQDGYATICVREYKHQIPYGIIESKKYKVNKIKEKPFQKFNINAGIYVLENKIYKNLRGKEYVEITDVLNNAINKNIPINIYPIHEYWKDIGLLDELNSVINDRNKRKK